VRLVADGLADREIDDCIALMELTIKSYLERILKRLCARNRVHAAVFVTMRGCL
jgi:DNA-binding NarL/FixJ family response regulator